jgi:DNA-binding NarL/FixJ family response regulator
MGSVVPLGGRLTVDAERLRAARPQCLSANEWEEVARTWGWSERESVVVQRLLGGETRRQAALDLSITQSTLQTHLRRALWKSGTKDLIDLLWEIVGIRDRLRR